MQLERHLKVQLTDEQIRLYLESPTFKHGVDTFLRGVLPVFLEGLVQRAARDDAEFQARITAAQQGGGSLVTPE